MRQLAKDIRSLGGENDAPSRNISRFLDSLADRLNIGLDVMQVWRNDRFGRGGDHTEFLNAGFPAVRLSVAVENYNWQHQDLRTEKGIKYGDTIENMDFPYLEKVTKLNVAALAAIASAPPPPEPKVEGAVSTDTTLTWERAVLRQQHMSCAGGGPMQTNWAAIRRCRSRQPAVGPRRMRAIASNGCASRLHRRQTGRRSLQASESTIGCSASRR